MQISFASIAHQILLAALCLSSASAFAQEIAPEKLLEQARVHVAKLASRDYAQREAAASALARIGLAARPVLLEALKDPHPEIRLRAQRILETIAQDDFERAIADFLADKELQREHNLPSWPRFRETVGSDEAARKLFIEMLRAEGNLLAAVEKSPREAATAFALRCQQLQNASSLAEEEIAPGSLAAILFVAADDRVPSVLGMEDLLYRFSSHSSVANALTQREKPSLMRKLVTNWIVTGRGGYHGLRLAMEFQLPEGLIAADKMLEATKSPAYYRQYAVLTYARLGQKSDIPKLEKLLQDASICTTHRVNETTYETQLRDVALVAIMHLAGYDPKEFGFDRIQTQENYVFSPYTLGFESEDQRKAAFAKWAESQK